MVLVIKVSRWLKCFPFIKGEQVAVPWLSTRNNRLLWGRTSSSFILVLFSRFALGGNLLCIQVLSTLSSLLSSQMPRLFSRKVTLLQLHSCLGFSQEGLQFLSFSPFHFLLNLLMLEFIFWVYDLFYPIYILEYQLNNSTLGLETILFPRFC